MYYNDRAPPPLSAFEGPTGTVARWPLSQRAEFSKFRITARIDQDESVLEHANAYICYEVAYGNVHNEAKSVNADKQ